MDFYNGAGTFIYFVKTTDILIQPTEVLAAVYDPYFCLVQDFVYRNNIPRIDNIIIPACQQRNWISTIGLP